MDALPLALVMGPTYMLVGLSLLLYPHSWKKLMEKWRDDHYLLFPLMFGYVVLGLVSVNMYNVWAWNVWLLVTITGWGLVLKGALYFLLPGEPLKKLLGMRSSEMMLAVGGFVGILIGAALSYYSYLV